MLAGDTCSGLLLVTELKLKQDLGVENSDNGRVLGFFFLANGFCGVTKKGGLNFVANDKHSHSQHKLKATPEKDMNQDTEKKVPSSFAYARTE